MDFKAIQDAELEAVRGEKRTCNKAILEARAQIPHTAIFMDDFAEKETPTVWKVCLGGVLLL